MILRHALFAGAYFMGAITCLYFLSRHPLTWTYYSGLILTGPDHDARKQFMTRYIAVKEFGELIVFSALLLVWRPRRWP